jgi:heme-degrading monooxygenase HmoA
MTSVKRAGRMMVLRSWSARATPVGARRYLSHFRRRVLPALRRLPGHCGALVLRHRRAGEVEITVLTLWRSLAAVRGFAGRDVARAVVEAEARAILRRFDTRVAHFEILLDSRSRKGGR